MEARLYRRLVCAALSFQRNIERRAHLQKASYSYGNKSCPKPKVLGTVVSSISMALKRGFPSLPHLDSLKKFPIQGFLLLSEPDQPRRQGLLLLVLDSPCIHHHQRLKRRLILLSPLNLQCCNLHLPQSFHFHLTQNLGQLEVSDQASLRPLFQVTNRHRTKEEQITVFINHCQTQGKIRDNSFET